MAMIAQMVSFRGRWFAEEFHGPDKVCVVIAGKRGSQIVGIEIDMHNGSKPITAKATLETRFAVIAEMLASDEFALMSSPIHDVQGSA